MEKAGDVDNQKEATICVRRSVYKQKTFDDKFQLEKPKSSEEEQDASSKLKKASSALGWLNPMNLVSLFTVFNLIASYDFKQTFVADLLSGLTISFMHIPGALAYGALTSLNPVNGLYTAFFPGIVYVLFGTSRHLSMGAAGITAIMVYSAVSRLEGVYAPELTRKVLQTVGNTAQQPVATNDDISLSMYLSTNTDALNITQSLKVLVGESSENVLLQEENELMSIKLKIATGLAFWCGVIQIVMAILRIGNITKYFSQALLRGFTTAASCHVVSVQVQNIFGIYYRDRKHRQFFQIYYAFEMLFERISSINLVAFSISVVTITTLMVVKYKISDRYKKQLRGIPIPTELIVIMASLTLSHLANLHKNHGVAIVGHIPKGMPSLKIPELSMFFGLFQDALIISVISFSNCLSVSDILARKNKYKINPNREMFAIGMSNLVGSFFQCFNCCGALARTTLQESIGGRTQMVTLISCSVIAATMLYIAPMLEMLPRAILGSIIIASSYNLLKQITDLKHYWKTDKIEFLIWIITFSTSILSDIGLSLLVGVLTTLCLNTYRTQNLKLNILGQVNDSDLFANVEKYSASQLEDVRIVRPSHSLFYINCDKFRNDLYELCPLRDRPVDQTICQQCSGNYGCVLGCIKKPADDDDEQRLKPKQDQVQLKLEADSSNADQSDSQNSSITSTKYFKVIILDCTQVQFIDESAVKTLKEIMNEYKKEKVKFFMTNCNEEILKFLKTIKNYPDPFADIIYLKNQDALAASRQ